MVDLQNISSNLLLISFVLISLCCLYLLYSNFVKIKEIKELKTNVEDLKTIFFNQQKHNEETYNNIIQLVGGKNNMNTINENSNEKNTTNNEDIIKNININDVAESNNIIKLTKDNIKNMKKMDTYLDTTINNNDINKVISIETYEDMIINEDNELEGLDDLED